MKAFVTGATGFVGSHLVCTLLNRGYAVTAMRRPSSDMTLFTRVRSLYGIDETTIHWVESTLEDMDALLLHSENADCVFHCAAVVSFWLRDKTRMYITNVWGTRNIVNACLRNKIPNLIHLSSVAALGRGIEPVQQLYENAVWVDTAKNSDYAKSKYLSEIEVWRGAEEGLQVGIVNPGVILGPGDGRTGSNSIYHLVKKGLNFYPKGANGFVNVEDVCNLMIAVYEQAAFGQRFLAVSDNLEYQTVLDTIAFNLQQSPPKIKLTGLLLSSLIFIGKCLEKLRLPAPFPYQALESTSTHCYYHPENYKKINNFIFTPVLTEILSTLAKLQRFA